METKRNKIADHTCWCSSDIKAGVNLAKILNDIGSQAMIGNVNTILNRYDRRLKEISKIDENTNVHIEYFLNLVSKDMRESVLKETHFPKDVRTHLLNLMSTKHKTVLKKVKDAKS